MRENTEAIHSAKIQSLAERSQQLSLEVASNPELALVATSMNNPNFSGGGEYLFTQQIAYLAVFLKLGEESYIQYRAGFLSEEMWSTRAALVTSQLSSDLSRRIWGIINKDVYLPAYVEWLDHQLQQ